MEILKDLGFKYWIFNGVRSELKEDFPLAAVRPEKFRNVCKSLRRDDCIPWCKASAMYVLHTLEIRASIVRGVFRQNRNIYFCSAAAKIDFPWKI